MLDHYAFSITITECVSKGMAGFKAGLRLDLVTAKFKVHYDSEVYSVDFDTLKYVYQIELCVL